MIPQFKAVVLFVRDYDASVKFYGDTLSLPVVFKDDVSTIYQIEKQSVVVLQLAAGAEMINVDVATFDAQNGGISRSLLCGEVENVDTFYEALVAKGVEFTRPPVDQAWGIRAVYFRDPEGNNWEISHQIATP